LARTGKPGTSNSTGRGPPPSYGAQYDTAAVEARCGRRIGAPRLTSPGARAAGSKALRRQGLWGGALSHLPCGVSVSGFPPVLDRFRGKKRPRNRPLVCSGEATPPKRATPSNCGNTLTTVLPTARRKPEKSSAGPWQGECLRRARITTWVR